MIESVRYDFQAFPTSSLTSPSQPWQLRCQLKCMLSSTISSLARFNRHSSSHSRFSSSNSISATMASSLLSPSISVQNLAFNSSEPLRSSSCLAGSNHGIRSFGPRNSNKSRVFASVSVGSPAVAVDDAFFKDYKPNYAFLFPGQVSLSFFPCWIVNYVANFFFSPGCIDAWPVDMELESSYLLFSLNFDDTLWLKVWPICASNFQKFSTHVSICLLVPLALFAV